MTDRIRGCFLGGAVGDALGAPVEFERIDGIRSRFGPAGIAELAEAGERAGAITDDTQMTLFTAEGLIRARVRAVATGSGDVAAVAISGTVGRALASRLLDLGWLRHGDRSRALHVTGDGRRGIAAELGVAL